MLNDFPKTNQIILGRPPTEFIYHYKNQKCQILSQLPLSAGVGPHALQSFVPSPDSGTNRQRSKAIGNSFMYRQCYISFPGVAVTIASRSSIMFSTGDVGWAIHCA